MAAPPEPMLAHAGIGVHVAGAISLLMFGGPTWAQVVSLGVAACAVQRVVLSIRCRGEHLQPGLLHQQGRLALAHLLGVAAIAMGCGCGGWSTTLPGLALRVFSKGFIHPVQVFLVSIELTCVGKALPPWAVLLVVEVYALALWSLAAAYARQSAGPFHAHWQLLYFQVSAVLVPWCVYTGRAAAAWQWVLGRWPSARRQPPSPAAGHAAGASCRPIASKQLAAATPYQSMLGPPVLACLKLEGSIQPSDLAPADLNELQCVLCSVMHTYGQLEVMGVSVRAGCVLVCFETLPAQGQQQLSAMTAGPAPGAVFITQADAQALAQQLLPHVLHSLRSAGTGSASQHIQHVSLQVGPGCFRATPVGDPEGWLQAGNWQIELEPCTEAAAGAGARASSLEQGDTAAAAAAAATTAHVSHAEHPVSWVGLLHLGLVQLNHSPPAADHVPQSEGPMSGAAASSNHGNSHQMPAMSAGTTSSAVTAAAAAAGDAAVRLLVQLWYPSAAVAAQLVVSGSHPGSHVPPPSTLPQEQASSSGSGHMQLWAVGSHAHLPVQVLHSSSQEELLLLQVEVQLPRCGLAAHHAPDGPLMAVQPLSLQLWCGDTWLSTTHTLINLDTCQPAAGEGTAAAAAAAERGGWWGAGRALACQAASELQQLVDVVWDSSLPPPSGQQPATCLLLRDVNYWLQAVRQLAHTSHWCVCGSDAAGMSKQLQGCIVTAAGPAGLSMPRCKLLAGALLEYAAASRLPALQALVAHQLSAIVQPAARLPGPASHSAQPTRAAAPHSPQVTQAAAATALERWQQHAAQLGAAAAVVIRGYACPHCEQLFHERSHTFLGSTRKSTSFIMGLCSAVVVAVDLRVAWAYALAWMVLCWGLIHLLLAWRELRGHRRLPRFVPAAAYVLHVLMCMLSGLHIIKVLPQVNKSGTMGAWAVMSFLYVVSDQLQLAPLPQRLQLAMGSFKALLNMRFSRCVLHVSWAPAVGGSLLATVGLPLMLAAYLRSMLMGQAHTKAAQHRGAAAVAGPSGAHAGRSHASPAAGMWRLHGRDSSKKLA